MNYLKRLGMSSVLTFVLAATAFAGDTLTPSCSPGQTESPPCASIDNDEIDPGQTETSPASVAPDVIDIVNATLWSLSLF